MPQGHLRMLKVARAFEAKTMAVATAESQVLQTLRNIRVDGQYTPRPALCKLADEAICAAYEAAITAQVPS
jgi:hypothetical protein